MTGTDFDKILVRLRTGAWNGLIFFGIGLCGFLTAANVLAGSFLVPELDHRCLPNIDDEIVIEKSSCTYLTPSVSSDNGTQQYNCHDWEYDNSTFHSTITSEFNLVCDKNYMKATFQTLYMIGNFFGSPLNGIISDRYGRRTTITMGSILFVSSSILTAWMPNLISLAILRLIMGLMHPAVLQSGFVLCMEICEPKWRSTVGILISLPWALGTIWWGFLGFMIRDWRLLQVCASAPGLLILVFLLFLDESPRWLIIKGKHKQAYKVLEKAFRWNKSSIPPKDKLMDLMKEIEVGSGSDANRITVTEEVTWKTRIKSILDETMILFRTPAIRRRTLLMYVDFIVASTVFYGLTLNAVNFSADPYIYMALSGLAEVPAYSVTAPIVAKFGRRIPTSICYSICGVTIMILAFIPSEPAWLVILLAMTGKLCISAAYQVIYLISSEIFPTEVRLRGIGTSNLVARTGATTAPFITGLLGPMYPWAPSLVFGSASLVAGFSTLFLPETLMQPLPETIGQLEADEAAKKNVIITNSKIEEAMI